MATCNKMICGGAMLLALSFNSMVLASTDSPLIASFGDREIRQAEVDALIGKELYKIDEVLFQIRRKALDQILQDALISAAAQEQGITVEAYRLENVSVSPDSISDELFRRVLAEAGYDADEPMSAGTRYLLTALLAEEMSKEKDRHW